MYFWILDVNCHLKKDFLIVCTVWRIFTKYSLLMLLVRPFKAKLNIPKSVYFVYLRNTPKNRFQYYCFKHIWPFNGRINSSKFHLDWWRGEQSKTAARMFACYRKAKYYSTSSTLILALSRLHMMNLKTPCSVNTVQMHVYLFRPLPSTADTADRSVKTVQLFELLSSPTIGKSITD